ncbi:hypothetical protein RRF57_009914 [Xylaria bambusicola]|uniref:Uncharacterized protein n=1 Tax=Xylaria bambusicola TaxID=326684 RepID=A0AAN7UKE8_9PEZI
MDVGQDASGSQGAQYPIYVGIWTNWSRGRVLGSTLTISRRDADLLIAFTAFFIAFVTTRVWRILCFVFHRFHSTADPQDAIYHQRQTIFRNSSSPESGIQMLLWLLWANRHSKGWLRPLPAAIVAIICISLFTVAGGFSSQISTAVGNEVLIRTSNCGFTQSYSDVTDPKYYYLLSKQATAINSAANYAQQCYSNENTGLLDCGRFSMQQVPKSVNTQARCPFKDHMCRSNSTNLRIDSGYLDSHNIFGLNAPPDERILFRNVLHCAPLTTTGFTEDGNSSLGKHTFYRYGADVTYGYNYVYAAPSLEFQYAAAASEDVSVPYANYVLRRVLILTPNHDTMLILGHSPFASVVKDETTFKTASNFLPIDDIFRKDADLYLAFLSGNGVVFAQLSEDLWYHLSTAHITFRQYTPEGPVTVSLNIPQEPASPLGCTDQYQFCNTAFEGTSGCGPLASLRDAGAGASQFFDITYADFANNSFKGETGARFLYFVNTFFSSTSANIFDVLSQLGATSLTSQKTLNSGVQGPISSSQWQLDVAHWWDISMAVQQSTFLQTAYLSDNSEVRSARFNYTAPDLQQLCNNQKIRTSAYASFSLFGLLFTLTVGLLLTLGSYLLEPISGWLHKRKGQNQYPYLEWTTHSTLQLQRLLHEEIGFGTWSNGTETIPTTKHGEMLGSLDITNPKHPVLCRPTVTTGAPSSAGDSAETAHSMTSNQSEHTDASLTPSNYAIDVQEEVNTNPQNESEDNETQAQGQEPNMNPSTASPEESQSLEQMAQSAHSGNISIPQNATEASFVVSVSAPRQP